MLKISNILLIFVCILFLSQCCNNAYAAKILATVGDDIVTDIDVKKAVIVLEKLQHQKISEIEAINIIIDHELKKKYIQKVGINIDKIQDDPGFKIYYDRMLKKSLITEEREKLHSLRYLSVEYVWQMMLSNVMQSKKITDHDIEDYLYANNLQSTLDNEDIARNKIMQQHIAKKSQEILKMIQKFYFVEIKK